MKIAFFIRSLEKGGAERQLTNLAIQLKNRGHDIIVVTYYPNGFFCSDLVQNEVRVISLNKKSRWDIWGFIKSFFYVLHKENPAVLHSYLSTSNILAVLVKLFRKDIKIVWGIRASDMDLSKYDFLSKISYKIECVLSRFPDKIISNSEAGKRFAIQNGFPGNKIIVISNGIDIDKFSFKQKCKGFREKYGLRADTILIGIVARIDPMKGYETFIEAVSILLKSYTKENIQFVCAGGGNADYYETLLRLCRKSGVEDNVIWMGSINDTCYIYNNIDIFTSPSYTEGFSNSIAEAMACGCPCVVTDVGDSKLIVGDLGIIIPPKDSQKLAEAWGNMIDEYGLMNKADVRKRIVENFSLKVLADRTEEVLTKW